MRQAKPTRRSWSKHRLMKRNRDSLLTCRLNRRDADFIYHIAAIAKNSKTASHYAPIDAILRSYDLGKLMDLVGMRRGEEYHRSKALEVVDYFREHLRLPPRSIPLGNWIRGLSKYAEEYRPIVDEITEQALGFKLSLLSKGTRQASARIGLTLKALRGGTEVPKIIWKRWRHKILNPKHQPGTASALEILKKYMPPELVEGLWAPKQNAYQSTGFCKRGHKFTSENTYVIPSSKRARCKICSRMYRRKNREKSNARARELYRKKREAKKCEPR